MAETVAGSKAKLGWKKTGMESSSSDEDAVVPGVNKMNPGNLRPKLRTRHTRDVRTKGSSRQPAAEEGPSATTLSVQDLSQSLDERRMRPAGGGKRGQVSLKDLCVEDKRRIANLIKELARVGEEREKAREELEKERRDYEQQILKLVEQQEQILKERQDVERHLEECQQLLAQNQQLWPPPPSGAVLPSSPTPAYPYPCPPAPAPGPASPAGGRGSLQDMGQSLLANVGSPRGQFHQPGHAAMDGDVAVYRYPQQEQLNSAAPSHPAFPHLHPHPYPYPQAPTAQGQNQYHPASASLAPQHAHQHQGQQQQHQQQQQQRPSLDFFASALQRPEPLNVFSAQGAREASPAFAPPRSDKEEVIHRFFASQPASDGPAMLSPKRRDPAAKTRERPPGRGAKQGVFLPPIMSSTQKSAEIGDFLSVDSRQEFAPLVPDASSPRGGEGDDSDDGGDARREEERGGAANRVMFAEGGDNELALHSPSAVGGGEGGAVRQFRQMSQSQRKALLLQQRAQLLEEQQRLKHILHEQEAMLRDKQRALNARSRHHGDAAAGEVKDGGGGVRDDDPLGLVPQRLAIDAALERQRAIVDSLELDAEHRKAASKSNNSSSNNSDRPPGGQPLQGSGGRQGQESGGERNGGKKREEGEVAHSNKLSDVVRKLEYSLHSDSEERLQEEDGSDDGEEEEEEGDKEMEEEEKPTPAAQMRDMGTSVSYRTIPRSDHSHSPPQRPFANKRDRGDRTFSASHPPPSNKLLTPGEKTMSVLEIINAMHSPQMAPQPSAHKTASRHQHRSPFHQHLSPSSPPYRELPPLSRWQGEEEDEVEIVVVDSSGENEDVNEDEESVNEALEESQILEEIFFLK